MLNTCFPRNLNKRQTEYISSFVNVDQSIDLLIQFLLTVILDQNCLAGKLGPVRFQILKTKPFCWQILLCEFNLHQGKESIVIKTHSENQRKKSENVF